MKILDYLDKNNLHHAYLVEGNKNNIIPEILSFLDVLNIQHTNNSDFIRIDTDSFKIEDARNLKDYAKEKSISNSKKVFLISTNNLLLEAQNSLLKLFEEPIENTLFFLVVPDINSLLKTLLSRFYIIKKAANLGKSDNKKDLKDIENFLKMSHKEKLDFIKDLLKESEDSEDLPSEDSARTKALNFLNSLEVVLQNNFANNLSNITLPRVQGETHTVLNSLQACFAHILKTRQLLRMPGTSPKTMLESIALIMPILKK